MHPISIGIDFGTSNTVMAFVDERRQAGVMSIATRAGTSAVLPVDPVFPTVGIAGDRFDYGIVSNAVYPALGIGSQFQPETKLLPIPLWIYSNFSSWHQLSMMNNRQTLRLITDILRTAVDEQAFEGLVHVIRNEEGFSLFQAVSRVKQELTSSCSAQLKFKAGPVEIDRTVLREEFESWIADDLAKIETTADAAVRIAGVAPREITKVFMTGGSALVPAVREMFANKFGADKLVGGDEFASVAQGLALMDVP